VGIWRREAPRGALEREICRKITCRQDNGCARAKKPGSKRRELGGLLRQVSEHSAPECASGQCDSSNRQAECEQDLGKPFPGPEPLTCLLASGGPAPVIRRGRRAKPMPDQAQRQNPRSQNQDHPGDSQREEAPAMMSQRIPWTGPLQPRLFEPQEQHHYDRTEQEPAHPAPPGRRAELPASPPQKRRDGCP
jgi:hypothetical protein